MPIGVAILHFELKVVAAETHEGTIKIGIL